MITDIQAAATIDGRDLTPLNEKMGWYRAVSYTHLGQRMAMPSIKRDFAVGRPKPEQTLPGPR